MAPTEKKWISRFLVCFLIATRYSTNQATDSFSRFISRFSTISIVVGVSALILILSIMNGFEAKLIDTILRVVPQAIVTTTSDYLSANDFPKSSIQLLSIEGVQTIAPITLGEIMIQSPKNIAMGSFLGIDPCAYEPLKSHLVQGSLSSLRPYKWRVILGIKLARYLGVKCGDQIRIVATNTVQYTPFGQLPRQRLFTVSGLFAVGSNIDSQQLILHYKDAALLLGHPTGTMTGWRLFFTDPLQLIKNKLPKLKQPLIWKDWRQFHGDLFKAISMEKWMMTLLLILVIAVGAFNILVVLSMRVIERTHEVAILRTQGATNQQLILIFMLQGIYRALFGIFLGSILGIILSKKLHVILYRFSITRFASIMPPLIVQPIQVMYIMLFTFIMALLATAYPALRATAIEPSRELNCV